MNSNQISKAVRYALVAGAVSAVAAPSAFAADATTTTDQTANQTNTAQLGKIEVTGTRIKRTEVETAQPVTIVTNAQLKAAGIQTIGDILQTLPEAGSALNVQVNNGNTSGFAGQGGQTHIDLRNLGTQRVLVLVNGKRWIEQLNNTVDLNEIPLAVIDHVEVLQDGASAIYGSDAIAGVVNIITVKNYNGAEANAYLGMFDGKNDGGGWDGKQKTVDFTIGSSGDKSGVLMNVSYEQQDPIWANARTISKEPVVTQGTLNGSSATPNGRFFLIGPALAGKTFGSATCAPYNPASHSYGSCSMTLISGGKTTKPVPTSNFRDWQPADHYNFAPLNYLLTPNEVTGTYVQGHYDLASNLTFNTEVSYTNRRSQQILAPNPLFMGPGFGKSALQADGLGLGIGATNPYNPFGVDLVGNVSQWCVVQGNCGTNPNELYFFGGRRPIEAGPRVFNENADSYLFRGGFTGYFNLGGNEWDWDAGYSYGGNYETDITNGFFNTVDLAHALDSPGFTPCAQTPGCVPFNWFGGNPSITPAMLRYVTYEDHAVVSDNQRDYTFNLSGDLVDLPAGPLGSAFGVEYLEQDGFNHPDATTASGNTSGSVILSTDGRQWSKAEYVEFDIPLVADAPGVKSLDLDVANRWSQYKWMGGVTGSNEAKYLFKANASTPRAALKWAVNDEFLARASWSKGFRVPSLNDLYFAGAQNFPSVSDPCVTTGTLPPGCNGHAHVQPNGQILTIIGGNPGLKPETAISRSIGFVYNPDFMPGFDVSMDYFKIDVGNLVSALSPQQILNNCYISQLSADCALIQTLSNRIVTQISDLNQNIGEVETRGIDLSSHYKFPSTGIGDFKLSLDWTFTRSYKQTVVNGATTGGAFTYSSTELVGTTTGIGGFPSQRANIGLNWNYGDWNATWNMEYIHSMWENCAADATTAAAFPTECSNPNGSSPVYGHLSGTNHLGATFYHDVQATYHADGINTDFTFGIRNLFDKQPPTALSAFANSFLPAFYRVPGRLFYGRVGVKF